MNGLEQEAAIWRGDHDTMNQFFTARQLDQLKFWGIVPPSIQMHELLPTTYPSIYTGQFLTLDEAPHGQPLEDEIDPFLLTPHSPFYDLIAFWPIRRMFGTSQVSITIPGFYHRNSRGQHAFQVALEALKLTIEHNRPPEEQFWSFVAGATHDPHPALGDLGKQVLGITETDLVPEYFLEGYNDFWSEWLQKIHDSWGIYTTLEHLRTFVDRVVRREELSLPGVVTHGPNRHELDLDFLSYTVCDAMELARNGFILMLDNRFNFTKETIDDPFVNRMRRLKARILDNTEDRRIPIYLDEIDIRPYLQFIGDKLTVTNPRILSNVLQLSAVLHEAIYFHPSKLANERLLAKTVRPIPGSDFYPTRRQFASEADQQIIARIQRTPAGKRLLRDYGYTDWYMSIGDNYPDTRRFTLCEMRHPTINLRLSTPVLCEDGMIRPWKDLFPGLAEPLVEYENKGGKQIILFRPREITTLSEEDEYAL